MSNLTVQLYGGEDYRLYDGERLVATVYAEADLKRFVSGYGQPSTNPTPAQEPALSDKKRTRYIVGEVLRQVFYFTEGRILTIPGYDKWAEKLMEDQFDEAT